MNIYKLLNNELDDINYDVLKTIEIHLIKEPNGDLTLNNIYYVLVFDKEQNKSWNTCNYSNFRDALNESLRNQSCVISDKLINHPIHEFFKLEDIEKIYYCKVGKYDNEGDWIIIGKYKEYYFYLNAECDYTGWDCQSSGKIILSKTWKDLYYRGLTDEIRYNL
jgi:hypothetical protein